MESEDFRYVDKPDHSTTGSLSSATSSPTFTLFPMLTDELKRMVISFVADGPLEDINERTLTFGGYTKSSLTFTLPLVSKQFQCFAELDCFWKAAIERQTSSQSLWKEALQRLSEEWIPGSDQGNASRQEKAILNRDDTDTLILRARSALGKPSYKRMYRDIVSCHLRFKGPVFGMWAELRLGEAYALHFFEPRYRVMIAEVMRHQPPEAVRGGPVQGDCKFIHANSGNSLRPGIPAVLVKVLRCVLYPDGRADVVLVPTDYVRFEKIWVLPNSGNLYYAQCLRTEKAA